MIAPAEEIVEGITHQLKYYHWDENGAIYGSTDIMVKFVGWRPWFGLRFCKSHLAWSNQNISSKNALMSWGKTIIP